MKQVEKQKSRMLTDSPASLLRRHSLPTVFAAILPPVTAMSDAFFTARLGTDACGAVGIVFPIIAAIQTVGFVFGTGGGSLLSRALGANDREKADAVSSGSFSAALFLSILLGGLGLLLRRPLLSLLGADATFSRMIEPYTVCLLISAPLTCAVFVLTNLLRAEGHTVWAMAGMVVANLSCMVLTPFLMFPMGLGLLGAGLAFPIGYGIALPVLLAARLIKRSKLRLIPHWKRSTLRAIGAATVNGLPSLFRQGLTVVAVILLNRMAQPYGAAALAALSVTFRVFLFLYGFSLGIGQGALPAAGYNFGAGQTKRAREIYRLSVITACVLALLLAIPVAIFAPRLVAWFRPDPDVVFFGSPLLRLLCAVLPLHGLVAVTNIFLQGLGMPVSASTVAAMRQGIFFLPLVFLLPARFGIWGVCLTQPASDLLTFLFTIPFIVLLLRKLKQTKKQPGAT